MLTLGALVVQPQDLPSGAISHSPRSRRCLLRFRSAMQPSFLPAYVRALSREDLSQWLVHFTGGTYLGTNWLSPFDVVRNIIREGRVHASTKSEITKYHAPGAACFYDIPPSLYRSVVATNPNARQPYGLIVSKTVFWWKGGRPAIYTDNMEPTRWHQTERFRLIWTDLGRHPHPVDWTHEREWRVPGALQLSLDPAVTNFHWWWPCVPSLQECRQLFSEFPGILSAIYTLESNSVVGPTYG